MAAQLAPPRTSIAVIEEVAAQKGIDPTTLSSPLHKVINPDALDTLFTHGTGRVTFTYLDYEVTVESDGTVSVKSLDDS